jgi:LysM repeat protein
MNTPNPLVPQGSLGRYSKGSSTVRIAVFTIVSIHAVFFAGLLMQGCRRDEAKQTVPPAETFASQNLLPPLDTNQYYTSEFEMPRSFDSTPPQSHTPAYRESTLTPGTPEFPAPLLETKSYNVVKGDTMTKIAKAHNVTLAALAKANPEVDSSRLKIGQPIQIPAAQPSAGTAAAAGIGFSEPPKPAAFSGSTYEVKSGDTLTGIARQQGTTVKAIQSANGMTSTKIFVGQKLKLPSSSSAAAGGTSSGSQFSATNPAQLQSNTNSR